MRARQGYAFWGGFIRILMRYLPTPCARAAARGACNNNAAAEFTGTAKLIATGGRLARIKRACARYSRLLFRVIHSRPPGSRSVYNCCRLFCRVWPLFKRGIMNANDRGEFGGHFWWTRPQGQRFTAEWPGI